MRNRDLIVWKKSIDSWGEIMDLGISFLMKHKFDEYYENLKYENELMHKMIECGDLLFFTQDIKNNILERNEKEN